MSDTENEQTENDQAIAERDAEIESLKAQLDAASSRTSEAVPAPPVSPADEAVSITSFEGLTVSARRNADKQLWELYVVLGGAEWIFAARNLGGLDDDLQEAATPGFKEKRREYYEREALGLR